MGGECRHDWRLTRAHLARDGLWREYVCAVCGVLLWVDPDQEDPGGRRTW